MNPEALQQTIVAAREADSALRDLKNLVEAAIHNIRVAEREAVGLGISYSQEGPLSAVRAAAHRLQSPQFDTAVAQARAKTEIVLKLLA